MKRYLLIPLLIAAVASSAVGQTPSGDARKKGHSLAGTWKVNLAKSKRHSNHLFQTATLHIEVSGEAVLLTYTGVNKKGESESGTRRLHPDGKEHAMAEVPGVVEISKWSGSRSLKTTAMKDGRVVGESSYDLSSDGKILTAKVKGIDASGSPFEQVIVFDRE